MVLRTSSIRKLTAPVSWTPFLPYFTDAQPDGLRLFQLSPHHGRILPKSMFPSRYRAVPYSLAGEAGTWPAALQLATSHDPLAVARVFKRFSRFYCIPSTACTPFRCANLPIERRLL